MSSSYKRQCKKCRRWIQLRQMPAGQWVAFEGYDTIHKCGEKPQGGSRKAGRSPDRSRTPAASQGPDLGFAEFDVPAMRPPGDGAHRSWSQRVGCAGVLVLGLIMVLAVIL
jgi:hypothetical protein